MRGGPGGQFLGRRFRKTKAKNKKAIAPSRSVRAWSIDQRALSRESMAQSEAGTSGFSSQSEVSAGDSLCCRGTPTSPPRPASLGFALGEQSPPAPGPRCSNPVNPISDSALVVLSQGCHLVPPLVPLPHNLPLPMGFCGNLSRSDKLFHFS